MYCELIYIGDENEMTNLGEGSGEKAKTS